MSQPNVLALLAKRKFRTMRPLKPQPRLMNNGELPIAIEMLARYKVGDNLYVKETYNDWDGIHYKNPRYNATDENYPNCKWMPSLFMPKKYARIWMTCTKITVQRPQELSFPDVIAEGIQRELTYNQTEDQEGTKKLWKQLYISIYGLEKWEQNLWHFVYWWDEIRIKGE